MTPELSSPLAAGLALILDMDGVIIDSNPVHREAWRRYGLRFGIRTDEAMDQRMYGRRNDEIVTDFFGPGLTPEQVTEHGAAKERLYRELLAGSVAQWLVPGVREFLERHADCPLGLATNAEPANVAFLLERAGLRPYFRVVVDGHQVRRPKPDPEAYRRAAELLGFAPRNCIVFEDSIPGLAAARAAGMRAVGVTTTHPALPAADLVIPDFRAAELEPWLRTQRPAC